MPKALLMALIIGTAVFPLLSCHQGAVAAQAQDRTGKRSPDAAPESRSLPSADTMESCDSLSLIDKEACYARQAPELIAECERIRLHRCAPYARVHELEQQLKRLNAELLKTSREVYASYDDTQPGYMAEMEQSITGADLAWRAHRDAHCNLEPLIEGMSRNEAPDLTEACRAAKTQSRISEIRDMILELKQGAGDEQHRQ